MNDKVKLIYLVLVTALSVSAVYAGTADAGAVWTVGGVRITEEKNVDIKQVGYLEIAFTQAGNRYTIACPTDNAARPGRLYATDVGTDRMLANALPDRNCTVKLGANPSGCGARNLRLTDNSNSTLGGTGPSSFTDAFATFQLSAEVYVLLGGNCPPAGSFLMSGGAAMTGSWVNSASQLTFNNVSVTFGTLGTPTFSVVYEISGQAGRIGVGAKGEQPDWLVSGVLLADSVNDGATDESDSVELTSEKLTVKCEAGNGSGTITGGEPGSGTTYLELEDCSDVGASKCTVEEPIEISNAKSTPYTLSTKEKLYGVQFTGIASTLTLEGAECAAAGEYTLEGDATALANKTSEELEFTNPAQEGSSLKLGGSPATVVGKFKSVITSPTEVVTEETKEEKEHKEKEEKEQKAGPFWTVGGTRLVAGKTHNFDARAKASFVLTDELGTSKVTCTGLGTENGVLLGSNSGTNGATSQVTTFSGCSLTGNGSACHLAPTEGGAETTTVIKTNPTRSEQVENVVSGKVGSKLLDAFYPTSKGAGFVKLNFGGTCTLKSTIVSGSTVAEVTLDNASEGAIELGQIPQERTSWLLRFPATPITSVWLVSGGVGKEVETGETAFNEGAVQTGTALLLLASTKFAPEPNALWSPLP